MAKRGAQTLHAFIMREAASTGQLKHRPSPAQQGYLRAVARGEVRIGLGYVNGAPSGVNRKTHDICEQRGWVKTAPGAWDEAKLVTLTDAGRAALQGAPSDA